MHILVVDDDPMAAAIISMVLEDAAFEVTVANDGPGALGAVAGNPQFVAVISDLNMPGIDGIELFHKLRDGGFPGAFILLSGDDPVKLKQRAPDIDAVLSKDDTLADTLAGSVQAVLSGSGA